MKRMEHHKARGFTLVEIMVVIVVLAIFSVIMLARFGFYEARHGCRSAAQLLITDMRLQQQRAIALERTHGITIAKGGNDTVYTLWIDDGGIHEFKKVSFSEMYRGDVRFSPGQGDQQVRFYPWTSGAGTNNSSADPLNRIPSEWSAAKIELIPPPAGGTSILLQGANLQEVIVLNMKSGELLIRERQI
jgi:prepilin-type N-terminal cleavage/methylation domain-containing protein